VGVIRAAPRGLGWVWLHCPLVAVRKIGGSSGVERDAPPGDELNIGWSAARVSPLLSLHANCSATNAWRRATCAGIARLRSTGRIVAPGAAWKGKGLPGAGT
jgi:hypothetical protein